MRPVALSTLLLTLACTGGGPAPTENPSDEPPVTDCTPWEAATDTWSESGQLSGFEDTAQLSPRARGTRGQGILTATLSWTSYDGTLMLVADGATTLEARPLDEETTQVDLAVALAWDETVALTVKEFAASTEETYPVEYTIDYHWRDVVDCFEPADSPATARALGLDHTVQAYAIGSFNQAPAEDGSSAPRDDYYRIEVPEGAEEIQVDLGFEVDGITLEAVLFAEGADPEGQSGTRFGDPDYAEPHATLTRAVTPGTWLLRVRDWGTDATSSAHEGHVSPAGTAIGAPPEWTTPYTLRVGVR